MVSDDLTARDVIAQAINDRFSPVSGRDPSWYHAEADHVLAALAAAGLSIVDDGQWVRASDVLAVAREMETHAPFAVGIYYGNKLHALVDPRSSDA